MTNAALATEVLPFLSASSGWPVAYLVVVMAVAACLTAFLDHQLCHLTLL